ncbi:MAG: TetR-like C-terminal domain-containing protein, partial [Candidatus Limnocylindrales bacterium]
SLRAALHGFASLESAGGFGLPQDVERSFEWMVQAFEGGLLAR